MAPFIGLSVAVTMKLHQLVIAMSGQMFAVQIKHKLDLDQFSDNYFVYDNSRYENVWMSR